MSDLIIDMTPTTINRTAIFHIALDTARAMRSDAKAFRYGLEDHDAPVSDVTRLNEMRSGVLDTILKDDGLITRRWNGLLNNAARKDPSARILFFDPLYVLFEDVRSNDVVLVLDLTPVSNPEWHQPRVCELYQIALGRLAASGAKIASISRNTALAMWANYGVPYDQITVVPLYLRDGLGPPTNAIVEDRTPTKNLLFVGSLETRKNVSGLIQAFEASGLAMRGYQLQVVGGNGAGSARIRADASAVPGVVINGFVPDEQLRALYATSAAFVYPSFLEGFGVPILEAASWGMPILTSMTGATVEVAPPGSLIVDPYDTGAISRGMLELTQLSPQARSAVGTRNRAHAAQYTFERYLGVMKGILALNPVTN